MGMTVGIDLGTTNSLIAYINREGRPEVIPVDGEKRLLRSVVTFTDEGIVTGSKASELIVKMPERAVYSVKRLMGKGLKDLRGEDKNLSYKLVQNYEGIIRIDLGAATVTPPEVSAFILRELKRKAEEFLSEKVEHAVITVPAYFNDSERQATRDAGRIAGLDVVRILNEPTAASLAYGLDKLTEGKIAVYDLGGGTFDISILKIKDGIFEVLSTAGDTRLGGDDVDIAFTDYMKGIITTKFPDMSISSMEHAMLLKEAVRVKHLLSVEEEAEFAVNLQGIDFKQTVTRKNLEDVAAPVIERTIQPVWQALNDANLKPDEVDAVVLVGGMTRMPLVRKTVAGIFGRDGLCEINPDEVVAIGAAIQADILMGNRRDMLLLDVIPLSLGIETFGGTMTKIIHRNSTIPASATELFTTFADNQTGVDIHVLQGEREFAADCRSLARFRVKIQPQPAGLPRIEVKFLVDANGILHVTAIDQRTGVEQSVSVKPTYGLTDEEVERMILESFEFAEKDVFERLLVETKQEAALVLRAVEKALAGEESNLLEKEELENIRCAKGELENALASTDRELIRKKLESLNNATRRLAELMMDEAVKLALKGKRL